MSKADYLVSAKSSAWNITASSLTDGNSSAKKTTTAAAGATL
jgi:hypothetical protein